jgi:hypothetical protein
MSMHGMTVLHWAAHNGYLNAVLTLLAAEGIDICAKDSLQRTALMYACQGGNVEIVKALLAALKETTNFDINDKSIYEETALIRACMWNHAEVIKILLSIPRINTHLKCNSGLTALDYVKGTPNEDEIMALFQGELLPLQIKSVYIHSLSSSLARTISFICSHSNLPLSLFAVRDNWEKESIVTLMCIAAVEKKYRMKENGERDSSSSILTSLPSHVEYGYKTNNGVHQMEVSLNQALYLDSFSPEARLFYLAFTHVDGTDGIANGVGQHIMSYVGVKKYH